MFGGVLAACDGEVAAAGGRIVGGVRPRNRFAVKQKPCRVVAALKKDQPDQHDDHDPRNDVGGNDAVPKSTTGRILLLQQTAIGVFSDHRRLPGRQFQDKRLVSHGLFDLAELGGEIDAPRGTGPTSGWIYIPTDQNKRASGEAIQSAHTETKIAATIFWPRSIRPMRSNSDAANRAASGVFRMSGGSMR